MLKNVQRTQPQVMRTKKQKGERKERCCWHEKTYMKDEKRKLEYDMPKLNFQNKENLKRVETICVER
jgi:hypothetical protein